jgi:hypothetical protein
VSCLTRRQLFMSTPYPPREISHQSKSLNYFETIKYVPKAHQKHAKIESRRSNQSCQGYKDNEDKITEGPSMDKETGPLSESLLHELSKCLDQMKQAVRTDRKIE